VVAGDRLEALYVLAVYAGMRQGEILGLTWADVDLDEGVLIFAKRSRMAIWQS
jgi:integrase